MNEALLFLHFVGLMVGAAPGPANMIIMRQLATATPDQAAALRRIPPVLGTVSAWGIALLWVTGIIMVFTVYGGFTGLPTAFWIKMVFVVLVTLISGAIHATYAQIRKGNTAAAARLPRLGPLVGITSLLAVLFAVIAFG
jgi:hypothetical protein